MGDGAVRFVTESVDAGDPTLVTRWDSLYPSNYGVWGAMGTRAGKESKGLP